MAERVGFEPTRLIAYRFSRAAPSTTRTPLHAREYPVYHTAALVACCRRLLLAGLGSVARLVEGEINEGPDRDSARSLDDPAFLVLVSIHPGDVQMCPRR